MSFIGGARPIYISGLNTSMLALSFTQVGAQYPLIVCADDAEEAGYLYADLEASLAPNKVLFFPSAYKRAAKYGHRDDAASLMRSMVMSAILSSREEGGLIPIIVSYPEALAESVQPPCEGEGESLTLKRGQHISQKTIMEQLYAWGYERTDYVYEVGQYAQRGSILDIYSYSSEQSYRLDFWDDELESLRTFEIESQLSVAQHESITIAPDLGSSSASGVSLLSMLPQGTYIAMSII